MDNLKIPSIKHPISLRKNTTDLNVFYQIYVNNEYNIHTPDNSTVIIDGGANIGLFAVLMANKYPNSTIIAIEPESGNFKQLLHNTKAYPNIHCLQKGIWNNDVRLSVSRVKELGEWGYITTESEDGDIDAVCINSLLEQYNLSKIDILKLDIETSEKEVFMQNYQSWLAKCKMLIVELHDAQKKGCSRTFFEAINSTFPNYEYSIVGENTVIRNNGFD